MAPGRRYKSQQRDTKRRQSSESPTTECNKKQNTNNCASEVTTDNINDTNCEFCYQTQTEIVNIPSNAESECIVLTNELLVNTFVDEHGAVQHNITNFSIYDENKHMCPIDSGLIEKNVSLYLTGYVKPHYDKDQSIESGIAATEMGPILEWWLSSHDDSSQVIIGVRTEYADYLLIEPHSSYKKYMIFVTDEKTHLSRQVLKSLLQSDDDDPTYEDILNSIKILVNPTTGNTFTDEDLIAHAQFIIDQVADYDIYDNHNLPLSETQCIKTLIELSGAVKPLISKRSERFGQRNRVNVDISKRVIIKATSTELVEDVFENMLADQLVVDDKENEVSMSELLKTIFDNERNEKTTKVPSEENKVDIGNQIMWKDQKLCVKMFILMNYNNTDTKLIGHIQYFYKSFLNNMAHIKLFMHGYETVLGKAADPKELFALKECMNINIKDIIAILDVTHKQPNKNWSDLGGSKLQDLLEPVNRENSKSYFYQLQYDVELGRFEYPKFEDLSNVKQFDYCNNCKISKFLELSQVPIPLVFIEKDQQISYFKEFKLYDEVFNIGSFVYLKPGIFSTSRRTNFVNNLPFVHNEVNTNENYQILKEVNEIKYPEYYRKILGNTMCDTNETTSDPFEIGEILAVYIHDRESKKIKLVVRRMYRAEHVPLEDYNKNADMNMLFWSEEEFMVPAVEIYGKCYVAFIDNILDPIVWSAGGPDRFYFINQYDLFTDAVIPSHELPNDAKLTGKEVYVNYNYNFVDQHKLQKIPSYKKIKPLRGLDIFAGCGGLSKGLKDSGLIKSNWAIEHDKNAAATFKLNNPKSTVFVEDCNNLLKLAMSGYVTNGKNQKIPQKGNVDFICGGLPYQSQYSLFKNSLVISFLSYIDYYRPKYFVMENVENVISFKRSLVLKLILRCITRMGYQCTFGILQAGNFGVPRASKRLIIMAAAPGERLPFYPEPIHVFNRRDSNLTIEIGGTILRTNCQYGDSAPMRTVILYDAWSDLHPIKSGANLEQLSYNSTPITHLQRLLRYPNHQYSESISTDHICKDMSPLIQARMELIPIGEGSDWRDLPNVEIELCDGTKTNKLLYTYNDVKNGKNKSGIVRGVCQCASGGKCNPQDRQSNTIIPWCLPHTGNEHNNWAGQYGRLAWTGFCSTTITNPEPMGKQGRVLHPEQHRVVSVRECARSQGFNDSYLFCGSIINKHRQIGNAVPPSMGVAIGHEIIKAIGKEGTGVFIKKKVIP